LNWQAKFEMKLRKRMQCGLAAIALLAMTLTALASAQAPASCKELDGSITDNLSTELGIPLYTWSAESSPHAVIVAIHGATLHGRSYTKIGESLSEKGYSVFAPDLRGFGAWYHNSDPTDTVARSIIYSQSEADLVKLLKKVHELYPSKPVFLMGESVGANMAVRLLADHPGCADGMILSGTAIKQRLFFGPHGFMQMLTVFFVDSHAQLDIEPYIRSRVSESKEITEERVNDPLGRTKLNVVELFKTRFFNKDCLKLLPQVSNNACVLVLEGTEDKLFHADDVSKLMAEIPCEDKTLHVLKGRGHINLETKYVLPEVEKTVEDWLAEKCAKLGSNPNPSLTTATSALGSKSPQAQD
jgi:alpha-beta hydrolase superfamily lysophospholipase